MRRYPKVASPCVREQDSFSLNVRGEVTVMNITLEQLVLLATLLVAILALVDNYGNKR